MIDKSANRRSSLLTCEVLDRSRVLDTLVNNLEGMAYRCRNDASWTMIFVSQGSLGLCGYSAAALVDDAEVSWEQITHPDDRARVRRSIDGAIAALGRFTVHYRIRTAAGFIKWVIERGVAVPDEQGEIVVEGFIEDITAQRAVLEALEQAELRYRSIFENASEGIFQSTRDGRYLAANPALARIYGYDSASELVADLADIERRLYVQPGRREAFCQLMEQHGEVLNFESEVYRRDCTRIWISENAHVVRGPNGEFICYEGTVQDISERKHYQQQLERVFAETHEDAPASGGEGLRPAEDRDAAPEAPASTAISAETLRAIGQAHIDVPEGFTVHPKLAALLERRAKMAVDGGIDWGFAELAAFGSLLMEGVPVRLAGQDSQRGTFTQRHSVFHDRITGDTWAPLRHLSEDQAKFWVYNSLLSEYAALGFEYGYSVERSDALVLWEAQFGDFVNGAQTIIDEFISSADQKWSQTSSVVLLLPHGYEGQGPDHSSARIERFLQMCAEDNMRVVNPSTGANHFHLLREHAYARPRRPLIVFTPKQLLRLKAAANSVEDFTEGGFQPVIPDAGVDAKDVTRVVLVSGRLYYDLLARREKSGDTSTAIVRVEQLYPLPLDEIRKALRAYPVADVTWVQDEPANQGPWPFMALNLVPQLDGPVTLVSRPASAATSAGTKGRHDQELSTLLDAAFGR